MRSSEDSLMGAIGLKKVLERAENMVDAVTSITTSGLRAAETRVAVAANTIANATTPDFKPKAVNQTEAANGGTIVTVSEPQKLTYAQQQNLELQQFINTSIAVYDAKATAIVVRLQKDLNQQLFDITA